MEIWNRIPYTLERNGIPFVRECTVTEKPKWKSWQTRLLFFREQMEIRTNGN